MDKFVKRFATADEAIPSSWKLSPLPKSTPKRPVGRPRKRPAEDNCNPRKRLLLSSEIGECDGQNIGVPTDSDQVVERQVPCSNRTSEKNSVTLYCTSSTQVLVVTRKQSQS